MRALLPRAVEDVDLAAAYPVSDRRSSFLRVSMVSSIDGASDAGGRSAGLSGPADKAILALLRDRADVVLVGAGTARAEGYASAKAVSAERTARRTDAGLAEIAPLALVSASCELDPDDAMFRDAAARTIVLTCAAAPADRREAVGTVAEVIIAGEDAVDPLRIRGALGDRGLAHVVCEGGPRLAAELLEAGVVDELCLTVAPRLIGPGPARIVRGDAFAAPHELRLAHLLTEDDFLFLRYATGGFPAA